MTAPVVSDLLDHFKRIRDPSRPEGIPNSVYLPFEGSRDHLPRPPTRWVTVEG
jgi:hypothetical protein